jgi:hypothetical protein
MTKTEAEFLVKRYNERENISAKLVRIWEASTSDSKNDYGWDVEITTTDGVFSAQNELGSPF